MSGLNLHDSGAGESYLRLTWVKVPSVAATRLQPAVDQDGECRNRVSQHNVFAVTIVICYLDGTSGEAWKRFLLRAKRRCAFTGRNESQHAFWARHAQWRSNNRAGKGQLTGKVSRVEASLTRW